MSSGDRVPLFRATEVARNFLENITNIPGEYTIAGSIRRQKASIGDIEIVCLPINRSALLNRLDKLEDSGIVKKALYGESTRWGKKLRGMIYQRMQVEVTIADPDNHGFQLWLRTGDGEKNRFVMSQMKNQQTPVRFTGGYAWHVSYDSSHLEFDRKLGYAKLNKLTVADEWRLYYLLGMTEIEPNQRTEQTYRRHLGHGMTCPSENEFKAMYAETIKQLSLF